MFSDCELGLTGWVNKRLGVYALIFEVLAVLKLIILFYPSVVWWALILGEGSVCFILFGGHIKHS